jgi:2'-5' RNA ligase
MPLSLWFILKDGNPFQKTAQELISSTVPNLLLSPDQIHSFPPHVTITSGIELPAGQSPQEWLDSIDCTEYQPNQNEVVLELDELQAEDPFFRKCNVALKADANLKKFAAQCRRAAGLEDENWIAHEYRPHFSLLYADIPTKDVKNKLALIEMKLGFAVGELFACCGGKNPSPVIEINGFAWLLMFRRSPVYGRQDGLGGYF